MRGMRSDRWALPTSFGADELGWSGLGRITVVLQVCTE